MNALLKLAILVATLLLVTNMAFAGPDCGSGEGDVKYCYEITATDQDGNTDTDEWYLCVRPDNTGYMCSNNLGHCGISLFPFSGGPAAYGTEKGPSLMEWPAFVAKNGDGTYVGYIWIPVYGSYLKAIGKNGDTRYTAEGIQVLPCEHPG